MPSPPMDSVPPASPSSSPGASLGPEIYVPSGQSSLFWRQLFSLLKNGQVVPVVGQDAVVVETEHGRCTLNECVARRVETLLELPPQPGRPGTLHDVACRYLEAARENQIQSVYWAVKEALAERPLGVPNALQSLARITAFKLYVTTTFDDLLQRAIDMTRFSGQPRTQVHAYSPERIEDLPLPIEQLKEPTVYHLLGRVSTLPDYVVTEEDTLEFVHSLQSENRRPNHLMDALRQRSLLLIGSGYSDWLMRFFLRITNGQRLMMARPRPEFLADARVRDDEALSSFLRTFSAQTKVYRGDALKFIDELYERWEEHCATAVKNGSPEVTVERAPTARAAEDAIFLSYASEDRTRVELLAEALRNAGLPVWFDREELSQQGGVEWEAHIRSRIQDASIFAPILSRSVLTLERRFFRREWIEALEVEPTVTPGQTYIVPICLDDLSVKEGALPDRFQKLQWVRLSGDSDFSAAVQRLRDLYRTYQLALSTTR